MRKPIIAGNWKMNNTPAQAKELLEGLKPLIAGNEATEAAVCVPAILIGTVKEAMEGSQIHLGAENMHWEEKGAFTGEISPVMLNAFDVEYVIIGHSERRQYFAETDETVNKKVLSALAHGLKPIMCVGETLEQREAGVTDELVCGQVEKGLAGVECIDNVVIAYEPVWAIGTGKTATADEANRVCGIIRDKVGQMLGEEAAAKIRIQYGGSMNPKNVAELMAQPNIDGGLIGGAALKAEDFAALVNNQR
ncbi:MAG: triose-phosphate isomerase [Clostridia bacterium]|nr:triose-phosphate isomerase [Clostridia bacterium]